MSIWSALSDLYTSAYKKVTGLIWHEEEEEGVYNIPHEMYAQSETEMSTNYRSIFRSIKYDEEGNEETEGYFSITHDDILDEGAVDSAIEGFGGASGDYSYQDWEFVGGLTRLPEGIEWEEE